MGRNARVRSLPRVDFWWVSAFRVAFPAPDCTAGVASVDDQRTWNALSTVGVAVAFPGVTVLLDVAGGVGYLAGKTTMALLSRTEGL